MVEIIVDEIMNLAEEGGIYIYNDGVLGWILSSKLSGIFAVFTRAVCWNQG